MRRLWQSSERSCLTVFGDREDKGVERVDLRTPLHAVPCSDGPRFADLALKCQNVRLKARFAQ
jgi:hypothetical protein